jgi:hypothetical protein
MNSGRRDGRFGHSPQVVTILLASGSSGSRKCAAHAGSHRVPSDNRVSLRHLNSSFQRHRLARARHVRVQALAGERWLAFPPRPAEGREPYVSGVPQLRGSRFPSC